MAISAICSQCNCGVVAERHGQVAGGEGVFERQGQVVGDEGRSSEICSVTTISNTRLGIPNPEASSLTRQQS